jgi:RHH-type rel operon transcriptional repressor/antitoxin RelB
MLAIRLPKDLEARLDRLAKRTGRTKTFYAREAIETHLEALEDAFLAEKTYENVQAGREKTMPLEDVLKVYDLES